MRGSSFSLMSPYNVLMSAASFLERGVSRILPRSRAQLQPRRRRQPKATAAGRRAPLRLALAYARYARYVALLRREVSCLASTDLYPHRRRKNQDLGCS